MFNNGRKKIIIIIIMSKKTHVELVTEFGSKAVKRFPTGFQLDNIMDATMEVMRDVSTLYYLHGKEKKQLVIDILIHVVNNTDAGALESLDPIIIKMVPKIIDTIIKVESGKMTINKKPLSKLSACFPCCC